MMKEHDREPTIAAACFRRWIDDAVQGWNPAIVAPPGHPVDRVDDEGIRDRRHVMPLALTVRDLQAADRISGPQDRYRPVVGMRTGPQLTGQWVRCLLGIEAQGEAPDVTIDL